MELTKPNRLKYRQKAGKAEDLRPWRRATDRSWRKRGVARRATIEVETTAGVSASAPLKSNRRAALSFECYKRKTETVWLQNNTYGCKPITWHDTMFLNYILRSHCWMGREHLYFPSGIGL